MLPTDPLPPPGATPPRSLPPWLAPAVRRTERLISKAYSNIGLRGLGEGVRYQLDGGGKRIRPALTIWLAEIYGLRPSTTDGLALAVELLHNAFLVHDDIEDGDRYRRGRPTLWVQAGLAQALNVGDFLFAEAYCHLGRAAHDAIESPSAERVANELFSTFTRTFRITVEGQAADLERRGDPDFDLADYDEISRKKTGPYLALGWVLAAICAGRGPEERGILERIGEELGPAFQIRDDLLDLSAAKGRGGEVGCDIREGKPSILYAHALEKGRLTADQRQELIAIHRRDREATTAEDVQWVIDLYRECGAFDYAEREMARRVESGVERFGGIAGLPARARGEFRELAESTIGREV